MRSHHRVVPAASPCSMQVSWCTFCRAPNDSNALDISLATPQKFSYDGFPNARIAICVRLRSRDPGLALRRHRRNRMPFVGTSPWPVVLMNSITTADPATTPRDRSFFAHSFRLITRTLVNPRAETRPRRRSAALEASFFSPACNTSKGALGDGTDRRGFSPGLAALSLDPIGRFVAALTPFAEIVRSSAGMRPDLHGSTTSSMPVASSAIPKS